MGEKVEINREEYEGKENVIIENLQNCEIRIPFAVKCIYIKKIENCKIYACAVQNATFIDFSVGSENARNELYIASHQIRIHNSVFTDFYLCARSNPIIENCQNLGFGNMLETTFGSEDAVL